MRKYKNRYGILLLLLLPVIFYCLGRQQIRIKSEQLKQEVQKENQNCVRAGMSTVKNGTDEAAKGAVQGSAGTTA